MSCAKGKSLLNHTGNPDSLHKEQEKHRLPAVNYTGSQFYCKSLTSSRIESQKVGARVLLEAEVKNVIKIEKIIPLL